MRRFYASPEEFADDVVRLGSEETRHLRDVLRLRAGDEVRVFDGIGGEFHARVIEIGKTSTQLQILEGVEPSASESGLDLTLAVSAYKSDKLDLVVPKAVELGVTRFVPIVSFRSEVKLSDTLRRAERWRKIALEATKQCERARIMTIAEPLKFEDFISAADDGLLLMFSEKDGRGIPANTTHKKITALVGPKGGWEDSEIELAKIRRFDPVKLGSRIMKADTAAITFAALLQHRFGDLT